jgi:hypothetical protein
MSQTQVVSTRCEPSLLTRVRGALEGADESLLCVAFISLEGVHLLRRQLAEAKRSRLLATTVFGSTAPAALDLASDLGVEVRVLNPSTGTYHPKLYLARRGEQSRAVIGSANLTSGLVNNVEVCSVIAGDREQLATAWGIGERLWCDPRATPWTGAPVSVADTPWDEVLTQLDLFVPVGSVVQTLGAKPQPNVVSRIDGAGVWIETDRSRQRGMGPQLVNGWMLRLAWDYLRFHGHLSNRYLLADDGLNVKRSSAVCALLAQLPGVEVRSKNPIELVWTGEPA